jgi:hypothetical protein
MPAEKPVLSRYRDRMDKAIVALKEEFASLRTGRASANLLHQVMVEAYGASSPISAVAAISVPEPRAISVSVWDRGVVAASFHVSGWTGFPLAEWVAGVLDGLPVVLENDSNVAALAEATVGAGRGLRLVFYTNVGSGIGVDGAIAQRLPGDHDFGLPSGLGNPGAPVPDPIPLPRLPFEAQHLGVIQRAVGIDGEQKRRAFVGRGGEHH